MASALDPLPAARRIIEAGIEDGLHPGAQLCVWRNGRLIADFALGDARLADDAGPPVPMRTHSLMHWMSGTKPVAGVAILQLRDRGELALADPVVRFIPEFAAGGKAAITLHHLLTHTGGFRAAANSAKPYPLEQLTDEAVSARLEPGWVPGEKAGYHVASSWLVLGEVVRRVTGIAYADYVRQHIFLPLGMDDCWIGLSPDRQRDYGDRLSSMYDTSRPGLTSMHPHHNLPENRAVARPGAAGVGPMNQLVRLYRMILGRGELDGVRVLTDESVVEMTRRHRVGMHDHTFRGVMDWGLGIIPNNRRHSPSAAYGYGPHASDAAVGHSGSQSSVALCDPPHGLAIALAFNGMCGDSAHQARQTAVLSSVYKDLALATPSADAPDA